MTRHPPRRGPSKAQLTLLTCGLIALTGNGHALAAPEPAEIHSVSHVTPPRSTPATAQTNAGASAAIYRMSVHDRVTYDKEHAAYSPRSGFNGGWFAAGPKRSTRDPIKSTNDDNLYYPEYVYPQAWSRTMPNGKYDVTVKMRESYFSEPGKRVFDVLAQGKTVLSNVDIYAAVGRNTAYDRTFRVQVVDGNLNLNFVHKANGATVSALIVSPVNNTTTAPAPVPPTAPGAPPDALKAGYNRLVFNDDFDSLASIDLQGTGGSQYKWFTKPPQIWQPMPASALSVKDSVLTIHQTSGLPSMGLFSTSAATGAGAGYKHAYFEARLAFDPKYSLTSDGWPSFWALSRDQILDAHRDRWPELDFFEAYHAPKTPFEKAYFGTIHDWTHTPTDTSRNTHGNNSAYLLDADFRKFHTYGCLWQPGVVTWYFDGMPLFTQRFSATGLPEPNPGGFPAGTYNILDEDAGGLAMILGTGFNYPLDIDYVRVWQR